MSSEYSYPTPQQVDALNEQATTLRHQDTRRALDLGLRGRDLALKIDYQKGYATSLYLIGLCHFILADRDDILETIYQAYSLFQSLGDEQGQATILNLIANLYHRQNRYSEALTHYHQSLELRRKIGDKAGEAGSLNNIGLVYFDLSRFADSLEYLFKSLEIAETLPEPEHAAYALANIAQLFDEMGETNKALEYFQRSLDLNSQTNDRALDGTILMELGKIHAQLGDYQLSIEQLNGSLEFARQIGNIQDEAEALIGLGIAHQKFEEYAQAERALNQALKIIKKTGDRSGETEILSALGSNFAKLHKHDDAIACLGQALEISEEIQADQQTAKIHRLLSQVYEEMTDFRPALNHYQLYDQTWQRIHSQETERRIQALVARSEIEKAQREVEAQRLKTYELTLALDAVQKADQQKTLLLHQLETQAKMLEQLAREDGLTGIANRRWLDVQVMQEFERARRFSHPLSIAMIDLDDFKLINDSHSHLVGDEVIRRFAKLLRDHSRSVDIVGRYGGEEFMFILVETALDEAVTICEKLRLEVERYSWATVHPDLKKITISIGLCNNQKAVSPEMMLTVADKQLYRAKSQGKNRVCANTD